MKVLADKYWPVLLVGAFFALTCIYNTFGENYNVFWNTYIKTVRELFLIAFIYKSLAIQENPISILFSLGAISVSCGYTIFRFICAIKAVDYTDYMSLMVNTNNRLIMSIVIFTILVIIKYLKNKRHA